MPNTLNSWPGCRQPWLAAFISESQSHKHILDTETVHRHWMSLYLALYNVYIPEWRSEKYFLCCLGNRLCGHKLFCLSLYSWENELNSCLHPGCCIHIGEVLYLIIALNLNDSIRFTHKCDSLPQLGRVQGKMKLIASWGTTYLWCFLSMNLKILAVIHT